MIERLHDLLTLRAHRQWNGQWAIGFMWRGIAYGATNTLWRALWHTARAWWRDV